MPCWLLLLTDAGFPLFSRSYGLPSEAFNFPTMGLLSAIHSSAGNSGFSITRMSSKDAHIIYRMFTGGLIIVFSTSDLHLSEDAIYAKMGQIYDSLVFLIGRPKLQDLRHVERTKRQIRSCANLLSQFLVEDSYLLQMGTGIPECCITSNASVQGRGDNQQVDHRLYSWTPEWSSLDSRDLFTISCFLRSATPAQARDVPVYLAHSSLGSGGGGGSGAGGNNATRLNTGKTPYRLLTISLIHELELVLLCGPSPSLVDAVSTVTKTILGTPTKSQPVSTIHADLLSSCADFPRHLPNTFSFHAGILGFMWIRQESTSSTDDPNDAPRHRDRLVCSFLASVPSLPQSSASLSDSKNGRRSPSPLRRKPSPSATIEPPPSPSSHFAPNNPLFSGSLLSEATVLTRSHALLGAYHLLKDQLFVNSQPHQPTPTPSSSSSSSSSSPSALPTVTDAYMLTPNRAFYACRRGLNSLYVMLSDSVAQVHHSTFSWQLFDQLEGLKHNL